MGKLYCKKENKWIFGNNLCPINRIKSCKTKCDMRTYYKRNAIKGLKDYYKLFTKYIEPLSYQMTFDYGISPWVNITLFKDQSFKNTRILWSMPEFIGHKVHQEYLKQSNVWWRKLFRLFKKDRDQGLFYKILLKFEKQVKKDFKYYKRNVWAGRNIRLMKECQKNGYKGYDENIRKFYGK